jgi:hypothetical protein
MYSRLVRASILAICNPGKCHFSRQSWKYQFKQNRRGATQGRTGEAIMSVPIRREEGIDSPLSYAPRRARHSRSVAPEHFTAPVTTSTYGAAPRIANAPPMAPGIGGHNIDLPRPRSRPFEGDVAIKDLRRRLSLDPQLVPEPPIPRVRKPVVRWLVWLSFVAVVAAIIVFGAPLMTFLDEARNLASGVAVAPREGLPRAGTLAGPARLVVESQKGLANEPLPLGVSLTDASGGETVILAGFAAGTEVSAGTPLGLTRWRVSAHDLGKTIAHSPKDFVGVMDVAIDLRSVDDQLLDSQVVRLNWIEKKEQGTPESNAKLLGVIQLDPEAIATLEQFRKNGDIMSARLLLKRAAIAGNAQAALELGMTFDPIILSEQGVVGFAPDVAQARGWYERAVELGSTEASGHLERLAHIGR